MERFHGFMAVFLFLFLSAVTTGMFELTLPVFLVCLDCRN